MAQDSGGAPDISSPADNVGTARACPISGSPRVGPIRRPAAKGGMWITAFPPRTWRRRPPEDSSGSSDDGDEDGH